MRRLLPAALCGALLSLLVLVSACDSGPTEDARFVGLAGRYLDAMYAHEPVWATQLGNHDHDEELPDLSPAARDAWAELSRAYRDSLGALASDKLSEANRIDLEILVHHIEADLFGHERLQEPTWNVLLYNPGDAIYSLLARDFAPLPDRLESVRARLEAIPAFLDQARANLDDPPRIFTETAISQNRGTINLILDGLQPYLAKAPDSKDALAGPRSAAIHALEAYGRWLESDLLTRSNGDFRLGQDLWREKLKFSLNSDLTPEEILTSAEKDLRTTTDRMHELALPLYRERLPEAADPAGLTPREVIAAVLASLAEDRPTDATIVEQAERDLADITDFVRDQNLVTVPEEPVELIVMPEHQRGLWIAYCDSPGPLEPQLSCFYAIAPTPTDWSAERKESFYKEYNDYMLQVLTVHEAMPGHYLQIAHANRYHGDTPVRAIFASGPFVEGWATYAEQLMVEAGWDGRPFHMQQLKMRLRMIINAIIDQKIHTQGMTEQEAMDLMMADGFQEEGEAAGKWRRACLTSTQLSTYYVGNLEVNAIRRDAEAQGEGLFDLKTFHDRLLGFGAPPPRYLRTLMGLH